ncbi:uncharacterized protein PHACADRAFT_144742 [Phanerochaete carnosa HHB-10118-sp]|uniref:Cytochrome P450 n=1 Tax=Phanerochaete carnosa (strain HHB-10118-sp) TaxID=650164 RepID=K5W9K9_PHACS|nr:uncharacterized protein PHACADRAFT_144742 [Phanerochaete carnosa HHB-10118-sp]EKM55870.1 hypothetical protein PHACADRAFT_144742 [Phanerochaete carnosa HHB-10118-sp]
MELPASSRSALACLFVGLVFACILAFYFAKRPCYPPGPKGLPIIGNLFDVPSDYAWITYRELGRRYGSDILHFEVFGLHIVVLNSMEAAEDLLDKRSGISSDRQQTVMIQELTGWHRSWAGMEYGDAWRQRRRLFHQHFRPLAVPQYHSSQAKAVLNLLQSLLNSPEGFLEHIRFMAGAMILDVVYAFDVRPGDPRIELVEKAMRTSMEIVNSGVYLVDVIPVLKHLPPWFPGAGFKRQAAEWKTLVDGMFEIPYSQVRASVREGKQKPCFLATLLTSVNGNEDMTYWDEVFMSLTGTAYGAGSDTTVATLTTFVLATAKFPEIQVAAHEELDRVLGRKRLPEIEDKESLPHITAILHEVLRWNPVVPLAIPHRTITDVNYRGYHIPAGSVIFANPWAMLHDENIFPDPDAFKPERFLNPDGSLLDEVPEPIEAFGFGRRTCPGRYFAHDVLWLAIANILTVFKIERSVDERGNTIEPRMEFTPRFMSAPRPFKCRLTPRFSGAETLISSAALTVEG